MINITGFVLNCITLSVSICTCIISCLVLILIIHNLWLTRLNRENKIVLTLAANIYLLILFCTGVLTSFNIQTVVGELYKYNFNSSFCLFAGYFINVLFGALIWSFANRSFFRLCRIVYPSYIYLQNIWLYIILPPIEFILICLLACPLLIWHDIIYIPGEYYCYLEYIKIRPMVWFLLIDYGIPISLLLIMYLRITIFLHQQSNKQIMAIKQRQERDLVVIRRIFIVVAILIALGIPTIILVVWYHITGITYELFYRISWLSISLSTMALSFSLIFFTPQVKEIVFKRIQRIRIMPTNIPLINLIPPRQNI